MDSINPFTLIADFKGDLRELFDVTLNATLPLLPLRGMVLFPGVIAPVSINRESARRTVEFAIEREALVGVVCQKDEEKERPQLADLYDTGVVARVMKTIQLPDNRTVAFVQAYGRFSPLPPLRYLPLVRAAVTKKEDRIPDAADKAFNTIADAIKELAVKYVRRSDTLREDAAFALENISNPYLLVNFVCTNLPFPLEEKAELLAEDDAFLRAEKLLTILNREYQYVELKEAIKKQAQKEISQQQREYFLHQQIKDIRDQLGESNNPETERLRSKAMELPLSETAQEQFDAELDKLENMPPQSPEYNIQLTYLQTLLSLPWGKTTNDSHDIERAKRVLDKHHYGMEKTKERILEHLALFRYSQSKRAPILCLWGPPGVGKTSIAAAVAKALGRSYVRISLGGVHDEAEIRGHRRTYIGAMPGRIMKSVIKAGTNNPVFVLDEIDKVGGNNYNGDPQAALLEVLDPEQNKAFHDNYLDIDYDLSQVLFFATANTLKDIPRPLLDRMELINVEGYLVEEKREIARRHLIPRAQEDLNLPETKKFTIPSSVLEYLIENYTLESGVRGLEKQIAKLFRKIALSYARGEIEAGGNTSISKQRITEYLGKPRHQREKAAKKAQIGVATGLAWTAAGGEILFIETSLSPSKQPKLTLTGNLGDVMKESAALALGYVKAHAAQLGIDAAVFEEQGIHIHVPEGATPKDGPSAGITIATSLTSALTGRPVRTGLAMTGEITLRGKVLPVGGIKEKILAAKRSGITDIVMCAENRIDVEEINDKYIEGLSIHYIEEVMEVINFALLPKENA